MNKSLMWRLVLVASTVTLAIVLFLPSLPGVKSALPKWWPGNKINLGLDLQGGMHLIYQVETEKAVESFASRLVTNLRNVAQEKNVPLTGVRQVSGREIEALLTSPADMDKFLGLASDMGALEKVTQEGARVVLKVKDKDAERLMTNSVSQALETIRNRIDQFGVAEPIIVQQGTDQILIQLPGVRDTQRALDLIGKTALLEFKLLDETTQLTPPLPDAVPASEADALVAQYAGKLPEGDQILFERMVDRSTGAVSKRPYLIKTDALMTGDVLTEARMGISGRTQEAEVNFTLDASGGRIFDQVTAANVGKRFAIILDGNVYSAPVIRERISGGSGVITGRFSESEAKDLAIVLRAGALPAPLKPLQNLTVGPTLGSDSIDAGRTAILFGALLVLVFMAIYYKASGIIADFAVVLNLVLLIGALAALSATLTLPGLAGILLTIGMGVDSNVLIFERIREELRTGKTVRASIDGGYDKAFTTVLDSHVTTLITAAVLFQFGTGPIKGFAVSLSLGIIINLFTALVGTKVVFDLITSKKKLEKLSI
ncbi:MAG TPA: protein translocase subunit SecD [Nitrospirota bacterium]|nr:protein translocase subunit SecD [Nitrospirota bacterium]